MLLIDHERRVSPRIALTRACKLFEPRSRRYVAGATSNLSTGGILLRLNRALSAEPGDRVYVGVAQKRRETLLRSSEMLEARIVRVMPLTSGEIGIALRFENAEDGFIPVLQAA